MNQILNWRKLPGQEFEKTHEKVLKSNEIPDLIISEKEIGAEKRA
jgi:hypothetical protein